jgi:hypothetical protein
MTNTTNNQIDYDWTYVAVLIDTSGSMQSLNPTNTSKQITGLIREQTGGKVTVTAARFSEKYEVFLKNKPASEVNITVEDITPLGSTALYESFCKIIDDSTDCINNFTDVKPGKIVIIVLTDGEENASKGEYSGKSGLSILTKKITEKQEQNWLFYFLGTNIDAIKMGTSFGIAPQTCINYGNNQQGCTTVIRSTSQALSRMRSEKTPLNHKEMLYSAGFTNDERVTSIMGKPVQKNVNENVNENVQENIQTHINLDI